MCKFCDYGCSCHVNPPCGFCTTHTECAICDQPVCEESAIEITNESDGDAILICPDCEEKTE